MAELQLLWEDKVRHDDVNHDDADDRDHDYYETLFEDHPNASISMLASQHFNFTFFSKAFEIVNKERILKCPTKIVIN